MRPEDFFAGATTSSGILSNRAGSPTQRFSVEGSGLALPDGSFRLDQAVTFDHAAPEMRTWVMRRLDSHHYKATLTDASGAVEGETYGNLFHVLYPMRTPFGGQMEQWLYLQPDGRTVMNEATVRLFGVVVAHLSERIKHEGRASTLSNDRTPLAKSELVACPGHRPPRRPHSAGVEDGPRRLLNGRCDGLGDFAADSDVSRPPF